MEYLLNHQVFLIKQCEGCTFLFDITGSVTAKLLDKKGDVHKVEEEYPDYPGYRWSLEKRRRYRESPRGQHELVGTPKASQPPREHFCFKTGGFGHMEP